MSWNPYRLIFVRIYDEGSETNLFTNLLPDDSSHFISVEFDHRVCHGDFRSWGSIGMSERAGGRVYRAKQLTVPNHRGRKTSLAQVGRTGEVTNRPRQHVRQQIYPVSVRKDSVGRGKREVEGKGKSSAKNIDLIAVWVRFSFASEVHETLWLTLSCLLLPVSKLSPSASHSTSSNQR